MGLQVWTGSSYAKAAMARGGVSTPIQAGFIWDGSRFVKVWPEFGLVSASSTISSSLTAGSSNTAVITIPPGAQAGDLLIAQYHFGYNASLGTAPAFSKSGWTVLASYRPSFNTPPYNVSTVWGWYDGNPLLAFPINGSNGSAAALHVAMVAIRGAHPTAPIAGSSGGPSSGNASSSNSTALPGGTAIANRMLVYGFSGSADSNASNDITWQDADCQLQVNMGGARIGTRNNWLGSSICTSDTDGAQFGDGTSLLVYTAAPRLHRHGCAVLIQGAT